jgi:hypothetical protein
MLCIITTDITNRKTDKGGGQLAGFVKSPM